jgi:hypothetical protein
MVPVAIGYRGTVTLGFPWIIPRYMILPFPKPWNCQGSIGRTDLPFNSNFSTAGKNKSVKLYKEELESSPLHHDPFRVNICHDG